MDRMVPPTLPNNQLQFNLNPGIVPPTFPMRFHAPQPIIIEKFDAGNFLLSNVSSPAAPLQFSYVSQDSLSKALQAAQQDVRQRKGDTSFPERQAPVKAQHAMNISNSRRRTKIVNSREYVKRLQNRQRREPQPLPIREHAVQTPQRDVITQTYSQRNNAAGANLSSMPVRSLSPPTRDLTHDEKMLVEINRLRVEITKCLRQIKQIETQREQNKDVQLEEDETERARRTTRAEEQSVRSARTIYALNQQITQLQEELARTDLKSIQTSKKSLFVSRLASLHRHVVRALQVHVRHLSDSDVCRGVTAGCRDLAAVIRRLSLCCAQLEVAADTAQPDDLIALLNDVMELTRIAESNAAAPNVPQPPRPPPPSPDVATWRDPGIASRPNANQTENRNRSNRSGSHASQVDNRYRAAPIHGAVSANPPDRIVSVVHSRKLPRDTVDRRSQLRSGIEAVLRNNDITDESRHIHGAHVLPAASAGTQSDATKSRLRSKIRGVLINRSQNQGRQPRSENRDRVVRPCCPSHYADPTVSTTLREQATKHGASSPGRLRDLSLVVENHARCPAEICDCHDIPARSVQRFVNEGSPSRLYFAARDNEQSPRSRSSRSPSPTHSRPGNTAWKERIERQFQSSLEPVLDETQRHMRTSAVSDRLLGELINDAAAELHHRQTDNFADRRSAFMRDAPSVEILLQRLRDMELEQDAIRQRWTTLVYGDDESSHRRRTDEIPGTNGTTSNDRAILFTRRQPTSADRPGKERFALLRTVLDSNIDDGSATESSWLLEESSKRLTALHLTRDSVRSIEQNVDRYAEYLAARSHKVNSRFNPWMAVERIADDILETCIEDVTKELDEINNDIVGHVYESEFSLA